jgi:hypothetical protein
MKIETQWDNVWRGNRRARIFLSAMGVINLTFAAANIFLWSVVALVLADPIGWATWSSLGSVGRRPDLFEYPYVMLWGLPLLGSGVATLNNFLGFKRAARVAALFPLSLFIVTIVWWTFFRNLG